MYRRSTEEGKIPSWRGWKMCVPNTTYDTVTDITVALEPQTTSSSTSLLAQHAQRHESISISPHNPTLSNQSQPDYSQFQPQAQPVSNLPPSLQHQQQVRSDDIWLAPPLEGDNGIGLSGVDNRMWFGNSGGMGMDGMGASSGRSPLPLLNPFKPLLFLFFCRVHSPNLHFSITPSRMRGLNWYQVSTITEWRQQLPNTQC